MSITITIPTEVERLILGRAAKCRKSVEEIAIELILEGLQPHKSGRSFDEILTPLREEVAQSKISDEEIDSLLLKARQDYARGGQGRE